MKYKRQYETNSVNSRRKPCNQSRKKSSFRHRILSVSAAFVVVGVLMSVLRPGGINTLRYLMQLSSDKEKTVIYENAREFVGKLGGVMSEFCFGYLRNDDSDAKVYAVKSEDVATQPEVEPSPDVAQTNFETASEEIVLPAEPEKFEPIIPCAGNVSSEYGQRVHPITGVVTNHNGIDIACVSGTSVVAAEDGTVEKSEYNEYSGNFIVIRHINGFTSSYAHLSERMVEVGQNVGRGCEIARSGSTGVVTGPHLHFEIRSDGRAVNPFEYIMGD